jgi:lysozyme
MDKRLSWWREHDEVRMRVLLDMAFNMGVGNSKKGLLSFHNMLANMQARNYIATTTEMFHSKWARDVKTRGSRLISMMATGEDSTDF